MRSLILPLLGSLTVAIVMASGGPSAQEKSSSQQENQALEIAFDFLKRVGMVDQVAKFETYSQLIEISETGFEPTHGRFIVGDSPSARFRVSLETGFVLAVVNHDRAPRSVSAVDEDGRQVSRGAMLGELVKCGVDEARATAEMFLRNGLGQTVFEDVVLTRGELLFRGSFFVYNFTWREPTDEEGVALRYRWLHVNVNPETCLVSDFAQAESVPSVQPAINAALVRKIVADANGAIEISRLCLIELKREDAPAIPAWRIVFEKRATAHELGGQEVIEQTCCVNALTGEVFPSAKALLAAADSE